VSTRRSRNFLISLRHSRGDDIKKFIITIDGPAAAGKSSAAKGLAQFYQYAYLESGSLYRAISFYLHEKKIDPYCRTLVEQSCREIHIEIAPETDPFEIWVNRKNVTPFLRIPEVTQISAVVSTYPIIREQLLTIQRAIGEKGGVVVEGRDMGTVVFPHADMKFYLDADLSVRGARRYNELHEKDRVINLNEVTHDIAVRDASDRERKTAPLKMASDAILIDSTLLSRQEVLRQMIEAIEKWRRNRAEVIE